MQRQSCRLRFGEMRQRTPGSHPTKPTLGFVGPRLPRDRTKSATDGDSLNPGLHLIAGVDSAKSMFFGVDGGGEGEALRFTKMQDRRDRSTSPTSESPKPKAFTAKGARVFSARAKRELGIRAGLRWQASTLNWKTAGSLNVRNGSVSPECDLDSRQITLASPPASDIRKQVLNSGAVIWRSTQELPT